MKRIHLFIGIICLFLSTPLLAQHNTSELPSSINADGNAPDASAMLDVNSTEKGVLIPRMTTTQREAVNAPANGLLVYDTDTDTFWYFDNSQWYEISNGLNNVNDADADPTNEIELPTGGASGQILATDGNGSYSWTDKTVDTDTQLSEAEVDAFVGNNGYITSPDDADADPTNEIELPTGGASGQILATDGNGSYSWTDKTVDTDTQLSEAEVDAFVGNNGYITSPDDADADPTNEIELPTGGASGQILATDGNGNYSWTDKTVDTDTQLSEAEVDTFVENNGYITSPDDADADPTNEIELPAGGTPGHVLHITAAGTPAWLPHTDNVNDADNNPTNEIELPTGGTNGQILATDGNGTYSWTDKTIDTDTNTQLSEAEVDAFVGNNGYITSPDDADADPTNEAITNISLTNNELQITEGGTMTSVDLSSLSDEDWSYDSGTGNTGDVYHTGKVSVGTTSATDNLSYRIFAQRQSTDAAAMMGYNGTSRGMLGVWDNNLPDLDLPSIQSAGVLGYCPDFSNNSRAAVVGYAENTQGSSYGGMFHAVGANAQRNIALYANAANSTNDNFVGYFVGEKSYFQGKIGIGETEPDAKLHIAGDVKIVDGTQAVGKVLTSDADGLASWQPPTDTDTQLTEAQVDAFVGNNGYITSPDDADNDPTNEIELPAGGTNGQILQTDGAGNVSWSTPATATIISDTDGDTKIQVEESADEDVIRFDRAGTEILRLNKNIHGITQLQLPSSGVNSTMYGQHAGDSLVAGQYNTFIGKYTGRDTKTGGYNTFLGGSAGRKNTTGSQNTYIGHAAGFNSTGSGNVFVGHYAGYNGQGSNKLYIDNSNTSSPLIYGDFNTNLVRINGNLQYTGSITDVSDRRLKENIKSIENPLGRLQQIKGYTYNLIADKTGTREYGVMAQDVQTVFPEMVSIIDEENGYMGVSYIQLVPVLLEATKELNDKIKDLEAENTQLKAQVAKINQLEAAIQALSAQANTEKEAEE